MGGKIDMRFGERLLTSLLISGLKLDAIMIENKKNY